MGKLTEFLSQIQLTYPNGSNLKDPKTILEDRKLPLKYVLKYFHWVLRPELGILLAIDIWRNRNRVPFVYGKRKLFRFFFYQSSIGGVLRNKNRWLDSVFVSGCVRTCERCGSAIFFWSVVEFAKRGSLVALCTGGLSSQTGFIYCHELV